MFRILLVLCAALVVSFATVALAADGDAASAQTRTGTIESVDAKAKTFELATVRSITVTVDSKTTFTLDGKTSTFEEAVKPESRATVTFTKTGEDRLATKVVVKTTP